MPIIKRDANSTPTAASVTALNRISAYNPTLSKTPDMSALIGAGASLCASGNQVCIGARPAFVP